MEPQAQGGKKTKEKTPIYQSECVGVCGSVCTCESEGFEEEIKLEEAREGEIPLGGSGF